MASLKTESGTTHLPLIEIEGKAHERGRQYGARAARTIAQNVECYLRLIEHQTGLAAEDSLRAAAGYEPILEAHCPDLLLEMQGIAAGAGCSLAGILLINARSELMESHDECTALAAGPEVTASGDVLLAQNWDWYSALEPQPILLRIRQPDKPDILTLCEAGQVGKIGLNSEGLGVCLNFLAHRDRGQGLPVHVILRRMLECGSLGAAIHEAYGHPRAGAGNILLAHAEGDLLDLELTATRADFLYGDSGWLVHANHYESPRLRDGDAGIETSLSTVARSARARRLMSGALGYISIDSLQGILRDHAYGAYAICRHADPTEPPLQQTATRASVIMELNHGTLHVSAGQPCRTEYRAYQV